MMMMMMMMVIMTMAAKDVNQSRILFRGDLCIFSAVWSVIFGRESGYIPILIGNIETAINSLNYP